MANDKKTCYTCAYRKEADGSVHTKCTFNWLRQDLPIPRANPHGIRMGWYMFPLNFDPVWQEQECNAHSEEKAIELVADQLTILRLTMEIGKLITK